ncbi:MAG: hypothetical protein AB7V39_23445, partial [Nitrospiraceae bacterium]
MMNLAPRTKTEFCANTVSNCLLYGGSVPTQWRRVIPGSVVFRIGKPDKTYFEGRADDARGTIEWSRLSGAPFRKEDIFSTWSYGNWQIQFLDPSLVCDGEQLTVSYDWQPHHLHGAEVLVRLNNEERYVPIQDL